MCIEKAIPFTTIITTIITTGIGGIVGFLSARRISTLNAKNSAQAKFRSVFTPALATIYLAKKHGKTDKVDCPNVDKFLRDAILEHASAVEIFRPFVPENKGVAYQKAWEKYRYEVWNYGFETTTFRTDIADPFKIFEDLIDNILRFANN